MDIYLIRHTEVNVHKDICYGMSDVELKPDHLDHFNKIVEKLPNSKDIPIYSSPLTRCKKLAEHIGGREIIFDDRLMELNFGDWELKSWDDIGHHKLKAWSKDYVNTPSENGESFGDLAIRVKDAWMDIVDKEHEATVVVAHGGVIRTLIAQLLEMDLKNAFRVNIDYGGISKVKIHGETIKLDYINH